MVNRIFIPKTHLVMAICLPLALLIGYLLAEPTQLSNVTVVAAVLGVLCVPLLLTSNYYLLLFSCNAVFVFSFLPGRPPLWMLAAVIGFFAAGYGSTATYAVALATMAWLTS